MYTLICSYMDTSNVTYSITDLRHKTSKVLKDALEKGYVNLIHRSKTKAAIVDIEYFKALQESYEDYLDTLEFDKAIKEKGRISLSEYKKKYSAK